MKTMKTMMLVIAMLLLAAPAMADDDMNCMSDQDCPEGYGCVMMACACADCAPCPDGEECEPCPPCDCPEEGEGWCEDLGDDYDDWGFYGGECDVDGDCPLGFSCEMVSVPCATNPTCPPCECMSCDPDDPECEDLPCECPDCPEPEACEPEEMGYCVYDMIDCESDADCGAGFECLEVEECWGSGSSGGCACPPCACETCPDGEECEPCECPPCECDDEPVEWVSEEGYCVPDGWSEIIEDAGGVAGSGSYEEARDAMAGELYGDGGGDDNGKDLQLSAPEAAAGADDEALEEATGCSTGNAAGAAPMAILFLALVALAVLPRRRTVTTR